MIKCSKFIKSKHVWILLMLCLSFFCHANTHAHQEKTGRGKFYVIGTGPAGPEHATYKAIECIREADVILCSDDMSERFSMYLKGKTLLGNPWRGKFKYKWKNIEELGTREKKACQEERIRFWDEIVVKIRSEMARGKNVAILDSGDPGIFGPSHRIIEGFEEDEVEIIPGLGCFQATMAALKKSSIPAYDTRFVMLTAPFFLLGRPENENILADLSKYPITMAFYMALKHADSLIAKLKKYYASDLPVAVVYNAGYPKKEKVVKGTLGTILDDIKSEKENWLGMIIVGRCLEGQPQRGMIKHVVR
ncbi:MAG: tetrapyrrole methylase [Deltaproteobacteria bacterium]|nr:tetrapyrrole methylase [Deltaproteobacteria bacterium]